MDFSQIFDKFICIESLHDLFEDDSETNENEDEVENVGKQKPSHQQKMNNPTMGEENASLL